MYDVLRGMRVVEGAAFIAAPLCTLNLAQMGAEVIRFDMIGGGPDYRRWPLAESGASLYWEGLNKGKKSVAIDLSNEEGRELAVQIVTAPGEDAGMFVTNYPAGGFLAHARLVERRPDIITLRVMGWPDGRTAVDYTVNAVSGLPLMTGPEDFDPARPVNHVLPAWDLVCGGYAAFALLAAERRRRIGGEGAEVRVPLGDVAAATLGNLGQVAEVLLGGADRPRLGNDVFGTFGRDFETADGRRVMIVAVTRRQWRDLVKTLELAAAVAGLETELGVDFDDEEARFRHRGRLFSLVESAVARRPMAELSELFESTGVCWSPYRSVREAVSAEPGFVAGNPLYAEVTHPGGGRYPTPGALGSFVEHERLPPLPAPRLGQHTDQVLSEVLGLSPGAIGDLHDRGIVAGPDAAG